ncbi:hypothetical protein ACFOEK_03425 [Litoribrevibacter euphylliae]|uniref:Uncharacterized protein n=1 Tax=Litoribrevibacter euphylliae TaxID=1834034 RepID=A0ABV7HEE5_9GAMM
MDFIIGILGSVIGNFLTDLTKSVMNWDNLFGARKLQPTDVEVPVQVPEVDRDKYARRMLNRARAESFKWSFNMVMWSLMALFVSAMLPILLSSNLSMVVDIQSSRLFWLPLESVSSINVAIVFVLLAFIPVFILGQIITKYIEYIYDREWGDVSPQRFFVFYIRAILPLIIVYSGLVVFCFYPDVGFFESFKYPLYVVGAMFVAVLMGYRH